MTRACTAIAHPNIALVKYWGKRDRPLNLPSTSSVSVTLGGFRTRTTVTWGVAQDGVRIDGRTATGPVADRVRRFLDRVDPKRPPCRVESESDFPVAAGLASSSSAFAALAVAAARVAGLDLDPGALSALARQGSGSACRSIHGGFVHWQRGAAPDGSDSRAVPILPAGAWDLRIVAAVVDAGPKAIGSTEGMERSRLTSPCYPAFVRENERLASWAARCVETRDLLGLVDAMERSTLLMQATMTTAVPPVRYVRPDSLAVVDAVEGLRAQGLTCGWTMDAGPNVKVLCTASEADRVAGILGPLVSAVHVLTPGGPAVVESETALSG
ncbi:MAG: diphosphomevalonate decarboxylase [Deltaproteobacteria bacterium]|nr:diphosphomevalonate decarboxylase [Deltaproteobacteria bacterium]